MSSRFYDPWKGNRYETEGYLGKRLLILGESHYDIEKSAHSKATTDIIAGLAIKDGRNRFSNKILRLVTGENGFHSEAQRADFWQRVAFCNYIQVPLPGPRIRPTREMWAAGRTPFLETLKELAPDMLLVLGSTITWHLPAVPVTISVCRIKHPSSFGFSPKKWHPFIRASLAIIKQPA
jgi:hypothetical protein